MSKYKEIQTEFRSLTSLLTALKDLGYDESKVEIAPDPKVPSIPLVGYMGDTRPERASVRIPRQFVGRASNDIGFAWDGSAYKAMISDYDSSATFNEQRVNTLKQRYALHEVKRQAKMKGYAVQEVAQGDGSIRLVCVRR